MVKIQPTDVLGLLMFLVGITVIFGFGAKPDIGNRLTIGAGMMALGIGAVFGRTAFATVIEGAVTVMDDDSDDEDTNRRW